jgi:hypothetical protein
MKFSLSPPLFGFIVATRAALGIGVGLLLADRLSRKQRRTLAMSLIGIGAATTIPAIRGLLASRESRRAEDGQLSLVFYREASL